jgi:alkylhydroperoxidase family enzyme
VDEQARRQAEEREAYILGNGPRLQAVDPRDLTGGVLDIIDRFERVNQVLNNSADGDRGGAQVQRTRMLADSAVSASSPELVAGLSLWPEILLVMLRHPALFAAHTELGLQLLTGSALSMRDREFAVLRIAWLCQAPYEWGEHVLIGKRFGLSTDDIARVIDGPAAHGLDEHESAILRAVDELHGDAMISDATWDTLARWLDERQLIELPVVVGHYQGMAFYQNSLRLRLHSGSAGLKAR